MRLRTRLFQLVAGTVVPLVALATVLGVLLVEHERETIRTGALARNRAVMTAVDAELRGHFSTLDALAASKSLAADDLRTFHDDATRVLRAQSDWQNVMVSLPSGLQVINLARAFGEPLIQNPDMESTRRVVATRRPTIGNVVLGGFTRKYGVPIRIPIVRAGQVKYVLTAVIDPEAFGRLIRQQNLPAGWVSGLVDETGHFIARVPPLSHADRASPDFLAAVRRSNEGWYRGLTVERRDTFTAYKVSDFSNWSVGMAIPAADVNAGATKAAWVMIYGTLLSIVAALGFAYWMGRRIATPITALAAAARALGQDARPTELGSSAGIREVREVALALNEAARAIYERQALVEREQAALKEADRSKDEFLAMLSHELRNPLGAITTAARVLRIARPGGDMSVQAHGIIERQTRQMTRLVEDLLDVSRLAMGKATLRREVFDLSQLGRRVVETWEQSGRMRAGRLQLHAEPVWVNADRARIEQVLANLLDNANKFSPVEKPIRVAIREDGGQALLEVSDQGEGIASDMLERVFGLFTQGAVGLDRARGGMGVGLALVKRLVEMHGGTVSAASKGAGQGASFAVRLPAVTAAAEVVETPPPPSLSSQSRRILVVDDNEDAREMLKALLTLEGHDVRIAADGNGALAEASSWLPDVVLMDIGLPDMEGYEVARRLADAGINRHMKLIALTGFGQADDERRAYEAGFDLHLTKPVAPEVLSRLLAALPAREADVGCPQAP